MVPLARAGRHFRVYLSPSGCFASDPLQVVRCLLRVSDGESRQGVRVCVAVARAMHEGEGEGLQLERAQAAILVDLDPSFSIMKVTLTP